MSVKLYFTEAERKKARNATNQKWAKKHLLNWRILNRDKCRAACKRWSDKHPEREKIRWKNEAFRIRNNLSRRIRLALRGKAKLENSEKLIGCSIDELRTWLAGWFAPGMTWENYGTWHIDHHRPCASFDLADPAQQKQCFHYLNLRPLWAKDNLSKGAKTRTVKGIEYV